LQLLDNNIRLLSNNSLHWIGEPDNEFSFRFFEENHENLDLIEVNNKVIYLGHNVDMESIPNPNKKELIFAMGIYSTSELEYLIQTMSKESFLVIVEPNCSFFNYVLREKDLSFFESPNVILFADDLSNLPMFLDKLFSTSLIFYLKNIRFYYTSYYREHDVDSCLSLVRQIKEISKYRTTLYGNSVEDSLMGFEHNMKNVRHLVRSRDTAQMRNLFEGVPAIVVAAGPSLNKNIQYLKQFKHKAVIIAVDTIAERLCEEGIIPDFICSIERGELTYTYFYKNKSYPSEVTLVAPLLLYPEIFEEFTNDICIPIRDNVGEYVWLKDVMGLEGDNSISIGQSCAHVAFGLAAHLGASPIVLVGQDLAYGNSPNETHASNTIYDSNPVASMDQKITTEGYYGGEVHTTEIWNAFRSWFESEIFNKQLQVINATEGGAKINHTIPMKLFDFYEEYFRLGRESICVHDEIRQIQNYPLSLSQMVLNLSSELGHFKDLKMRLKKQHVLLQGIKLRENESDEKLLKALKKLEKTDSLFNELMGHMLLRHNLQALLITSIWNLFEIEQVLSTGNLRKNKKIQLGFLEISIVVLNKITETIESTLAELQDETSVII